MDKNSSSDPQDLPIFKRLLNFLGINRAPGTAEDLESEIQELIEEGEEHGLISSQEGLMINSIFDLKDTMVREIMTPRNEMICAPASATGPEIVSLINDQGFSRIPVYSEDTDHIIGIIHAKDLLNCAAQSSPQTAGEISNPVYSVLETENVVDLLKNFQSKKIHMAIVTDEFGITRGLVTLEDILEEIVGEIADEYDIVEPRWRVLNDSTIVTDAKINLEEIESFFKIRLPEGPYESVGGLIIHQLGRVPETGAVLDIEALSFQVVLATKRRIITVKIQKKR